MSTTKIEWATKSWNPISGCTPISEGCANCYAARMARRLAGRYGYPKDDPFKITFHGDRLDEPLHWRKPQKVFVCSMGDLFHEDVTDYMLNCVFNTMERQAIAPGWAERTFNSQFTKAGDYLPHTFMVLTKRPERMRDFVNSWLDSFSKEGVSVDTSNIWLGVTAENQRTADERIPILLQIPAAKRFVSVEPMLEPVNVAPWLQSHRCGSCSWRGVSDDITEVDDNQQELCPNCGLPNTGKIPDFMTESENYLPLDWVIAGPETGPRARPYDPRWIANLYDQCRVAGVPFFDKKDVLGETIQEWPR